MGRSGEDGGMDVGRRVSGGLCRAVRTTPLSLSLSSRFPTPVVGGGGLIDRVRATNTSLMTRILFSLGL